MSRARPPAPFLAPLLALVLLGGLSARSVQGEEAEAKQTPWQKITAGATKREGFLTLWVKDGGVHAELGPAHFDKDFLLMASVSRGIGAHYPFYTGTTLNPDFLMAFRKTADKKVQLLRRETKYRARPGTPMARAVEMSYSDAVVSAVPIAAEQGGKVLIDLGNVFLRDFLGLAGYLSSSLGGRFSFDPNKSEWGEVKSFPKNAELRVRTVYSSGGEAGEAIVADPRGVAITMHYTLRSLADLQGYQPRVADDRVGYFLTVHKDFSSEGPDAFVRYVNRWRLEKADPGPGRSAPKEPIVFWLENTVPYKWRSWLRKGVEEWNRAFEEAGFVGAIEVRQMPDDADWDPEDSNYNVLRWVTSHDLGYGAIGPSRVNPLTGQILDADVLIEAEVVRNFSNIYTRYTPKEAAMERLDALEGLFLPRTLCTAALHRSEEAAFAVLAQALLLPTRPDDVPEEYIGQYLLALAMHEVGHTLGLRHNFKGSTWVPNDKLQDATWTRANGLTGSTMDYLPVNFSDDPANQGEWFESRVGPYDVWAIRYGYTPLTGGTWGERKALLEIAAESARPGHAYGTDEDGRAPGSMDPHCTTDDLGQDPLLYCRSRLRLLDRVFQADWNRLASPEYGFIPIREGVTRTFNAKRHTLSLATRWIGGVHHRRHHPGTTTDEKPLEPVDPERQREALAFVLENGFRPESWRLAPETMRLLAPSRWSHWASEDRGEARLDWSYADLVRSRQNEILGDLFRGVVQARVVDNELKALAGQSPFTLAELYQGVTDAVFSEYRAPDARAPDALRRQLQLDHVARLRAMLIGRAGGVPDEATTQAFAVFEGLRETLGGYTAPDLTTRAHVQRLLRDIDGALAPQTVSAR